MSGAIEQPRFTCALGACQSVVAIKKGVPILHSGPGCGVQVSRIIGQGEGYAGGSTMPCTNAEESDVVFGGEKKLRDVVENSFKVIDGDLYVVITGCTAAITGDDVAAVVGEFQEDDKPVVYVEQIKRVLTGIGLKVNILFGNESEGVSEWKSIPQAEFNIFAGSWAGLDIVKHLKRKYGTPYLHFPYTPIGAKETSKFLRAVAEFGNLDQEKVEAYIDREEKKFYAHIDKMASFMLEFRYGIPRRFYTLADASNALGFSKFFLNELGIIPGIQFIVDDIPEKYQESVLEEFSKISDLQTRDVKVVFDPDAGLDQKKLLEDAKDYQDKRLLILGSSWDKHIADELHADLLIISVPVQHRLVMNCGYAGYEGGLRAIEDIYDRVLATYR